MQATPAVAALTLWSIWLSPVAWGADPPVVRAHVPVIYGTDLFHPYDDPDDHYDLATLFAVPEFDIRAILLDLGDRQRQKPGRVPLEQMFRLTGRRVPYATGLAGKLKSPQDTGPDAPHEHQGGVELLLNTLYQTQEPITIITAGSLRDVCAAFNREPGLFRAKVARLYINAGAVEGAVEWNVSLDLNAYLGLMRAKLPIYWCPCLPMQPHRHSTWWKFRQAEVLEGLPTPLLNYFIYALQQVRPEEIDPLKAIDMDLRPWRHLPASMDRNMWCTASFLHAAGYRLPRSDPGADSQQAGATATSPASAGTNEAFTLLPVRVEIDDQGRTKSMTPDPQGSIRVFTTEDPVAYQKAMTGWLQRLLRQFPKQKNPPANQAGGSSDPFSKRP